MKILCYKFFPVKFDDLAKSQLSHADGLWKKLDILGVVSETTIWQYMWYGESSFQIYNDVDRAFYESIKFKVDVEEHAKTGETFLIAGFRFHYCPNPTTKHMDFGDPFQSVFMYDKAAYHT